MPQSFEIVYFSLPVPDNLKWKASLKVCVVFWHVALKMCRKVLAPFTSTLPSPAISNGKRAWNFAAYFGMLHSKHGAKFWARLPQPLRPRKSQIENESETLRRILARGFQSMPQSFEPVFFSLVVPSNLKSKRGLKLRDVFWHVAVKMCRKLLSTFTSASPSTATSNGKRA